MSSKVCPFLSMNKKDFCLKDNTFMNTFKEEPKELFRGEYMAQRRSSAAEVEMDRKKLGKEKF